MRQRDLARLLVKVAALLELPQAIERLIDGAKRPVGLELVGLTFAPISISLLAGLGMFWCAGPIVDRALLSVPTTDSADVFDFKGFEEIALTILGFYVLTAGLAEMVYYWTPRLFYYDLIMKAEAPKILPREFGGLLAGAMRVLIGPRPCPLQPGFRHLPAASAGVAYGWTAENWRRGPMNVATARQAGALASLHDAKAGTPAQTI